MLPETHQATINIAKSKSMRWCLQYALTYLFQISKKRCLTIKLRTISAFDKHFLYFFNPIFKTLKFDLSPVPP
ncbi:conserved hypothetical protein [Acinetobacter proteolyticus]|uniref:Uncharacterized protein n=1 Tax=Acinetobacter proteolyticus TaxID=1776741 RepID=A0A653K1J7_9GAMM|nr:conserved hypothetical protein [Acinetobacter proteolyticus]